MPRWVVIRNRTRGGGIVARARWCESFVCRLRGLMLSSPPPSGSGLLLVESRSGRWNTAIHMFGMRFPIGAVWIDDRMAVVDARRARPWAVCVPAAAARFTLEALPDVLDRVGVGDELEFEDDPR